MLGCSFASSVEDSMFTAIAFFAMAGIVWFSDRRELSERSEPAVPVDDAFFRARLLFIRQDVRLLVYLLMAILLMLGVIADRLH
jgi:hypothetical protein